jgi:hypothetical protein
MRKVADLANGIFIQEVQAAFDEACTNSEKLGAYYAACEDIYDDIYAMTDDYMSEAGMVCVNANFCPK